MFLTNLIQYLKSRVEISKYGKILSEIEIAKNSIRLQALLKTPKNSHALPCTLQRSKDFVSQLNFNLKIVIDGVSRPHI